MKKDIILFAAIFLVLSMIASGTYAYWQWVNGDETTVVFNTVGNIDKYINYHTSGSIFSGEWRPTAGPCDLEGHTIGFSKKEELSSQRLVATIKMNVNSIGENIKKSDNVHWEITAGINCGETLGQGTFKNVSAGSTIILKENIEITTTDRSFQIHIWADQNGSDISILSGETINVNIWTQIDMFEGETLLESYGSINAAGQFIPWDELVNDGLITVSNGVITGSNGVSGELSIPNSITSIGDNAFERQLLYSVVIPDSVTSIGSSAFMGNPLSNVHIPNSVTSIGYFAFIGCGLSSVNIPNSVTSIGYSAFDLNSLTSVYIPKSVTSIESAVFRDNNLSSVYIPKSVTYIADDAFSGNSIKDVYYEGTSQEWDAINIDEYGNESLINATMHYNYNGW